MCDLGEAICQYNTIHNMPSRLAGQFKLWLMYFPSIVNFCGVQKCVEKIYIHITTHTWLEYQFAICKLVPLTATSYIGIANCEGQIPTMSVIPISILRDLRHTDLTVVLDLKADRRIYDERIPSGIQDATEVLPPLQGKRQSLYQL